MFTFWTHFLMFPRLVCVTIPLLILSLFRGSQRYKVSSIQEIQLSVFLMCSETSRIITSYSIYIPCCNYVYLNHYQYKTLSCHFEEGGNAKTPVQSITKFALPNILCCNFIQFKFASDYTQHYYGYWTTQTHNVYLFQVLQ